MSNNLFISYDLHSPGQDYQNVIKVIKSLGNWAKIHKSFWYVNSNLTAQQAAEIVWNKMDSDDSLIVVNASTNQSHWFNLSQEVSDYLRSKWNG